MRFDKFIWRGLAALALITSQYSIVSLHSSAIISGCFRRAKKMESAFRPCFSELHDKSALVNDQLQNTRNLQCKPPIKHGKAVNNRIAKHHQVSVTSDCFLKSSISIKPLSFDNEPFPTSRLKPPIRPNPYTNKTAKDPYSLDTPLCSAA